MSEYINIGEYINESIGEIIIDNNYNLQCSFENKDLSFSGCADLFYQLITTTHTQFYGFGTEVGFLPDKCDSDTTVESFEPVFQSYEVALNKNQLLIVYFPLLQNLYKALEQENTNKINESIVELKRVISVANEQLFMYRGYVYECLVIDFVNHLHTYKLVELYNQKNPNNCYHDVNAKFYTSGDGIKRSLEVSRSIMTDVYFEKAFMLYVEHYIEKDLIIKVCENCGKTFVAKNDSVARYCKNLYTEKQTCGQYAAAKSYRLKEHGRLSIQTKYNRLYTKIKRHIQSEKLSEQALLELQRIYPMYKSFFEEAPTLNFINDFEHTVEKIMKNNKL